MNNKERYKEAFSVIQSSKDYLMEVSDMKVNSGLRRRSFATLLVIALVIVTCSVTAYAADVGGIRTMVKSWINGEQREVIITDNGEDSYKFSYEEDGKEQSYGGGGVAIEEDGSERALSGEELLSDKNKYASVEDKDGRVMIYYYDQAIDITDMFGEDGVCRVALSYEGDTVYVEAKHNGGLGYETSQSKIVTSKEKELYKVIGQE